MDKQIKFIALGGQDERGKNCYLIEYNNDIFIFNIGVKMPINGALGINMITVSFKYLLENKNRIKGIFVGTANFSNIGGLQFLLQELNMDIPIYTSSIGKSIIDCYFEKKVRTKKEILYHIVVLNSLHTFKINNVEFVPFRVSNYLPESFGWVIKTPIGSIVFIDDFFINNNKLKGFNSQLNYLPNIIGKSEVLALIVGMGNVGKYDGFTAPNYKTEGFYEGIVNSCPGRIIVALNDYNAYSILVLAALAREKSRPFIIYSTTFINTFNTIIKNKMFNPKHLIAMPISSIKNSENSIVIISETEENLYKKLFSMASNQIPSIPINEKDTFVLGTHLVPGYESHAAKLLDELSRQNLKIYTLPKTVLPLTASNEDQKFLIDLLKPKAIFPIEGYYMNFVRYQKVSSKCIKSNDVHFLDNGDCALISKDEIKIERDNIENNGLKYISVNGVLDSQTSVLSERKQMSTSGVIMTNVFLDKKEQKFYSYHYLKSIGLVINEKDNYLLDVLNEKFNLFLTKAIAYKDDNKTIDTVTTKNNLKKNILRFFEKKTNKKPLVLPTIIEV
ncbi:MAG: ribonuclease J [Ureaplasma sp.]|nr:ribonuclease J [Ureaplasma sp.]